MSDLYDQANGLNVNSSADRSFGSVLYREEEDIVSCTRYAELDRVYHEHNIREFFGISIIEFLDLPGWRINILTESALEFMKDKDAELSEINNELKQEGVRTKGNIDNILGEHNG